LLRRRVQVFIADKHFEGCAGLTVSEEMKVFMWGRDLAAEYERLHDDAAAGRPSLLDAYGATSAAPDLASPPSPSAP
jgi:Mlc titration factor MtfA (ptsG expression regulator)